MTLQPCYPVLSRPPSRRRYIFVVFGLLLVVIGSGLFALYWGADRSTDGNAAHEAITVDGLTFFLNPHDQVITPLMRKTGRWEPTQTAVILSGLSPGDTFIDVGANIGWYTVHAARAVGESGRVIAFEPDPESFGFLERNVRENKLNNVILEQKALADQPGQLQLFLDRVNRGGHRIYGNAKQHTTVNVAAMRLDDYLKNVPGNTRMIKIDVEGAEGIVFRGMRGTLEKHRDITVVMEFFPKLLRAAGSNPSQLLEEFSALGFNVGLISVTHQRFIPVPPDQFASLTAALEQKGAYQNLVLQRPPPQNNRKSRGRGAN